MILVNCRRNGRQAVYNVLLDSNVTDKVRFLLFGTASSNSNQFLCAWHNINSASYESDDEFLVDLNHVKNEVVFLKMQLQTFLPRDDYEILFEVAISFLGDTSM